MIYAASKILWWFARPDTVLLLLSIAGAAFLCLRPGRRLGLGFLLPGVAGLVACAWLPLGTWLMRPLEDRFSPPHRLPAQIDGIIVLGGAIDLHESRSRGVPSLNVRAGRMTAFVALARRYPAARLVFTGGKSDPLAEGPAEADVARAFFAGLGLDRRHFLFEDRSRNTRENALFSKRLVGPAPHQLWILVTSAADMPRAVGCFRAVGWPVVAFPVDYHTPRSGIGSAPGLARGLDDVDWAAHEWVGLLYYRWRGWTPSLFPGP